MLDQIGARPAMVVINTPKITVCFRPNLWATQLLIKIAINKKNDGMVVSSSIWDSATSGNDFARTGMFALMAGADAVITDTSKIENLIKDLFVFGIVKLLIHYFNDR